MKDRDNELKKPGKSGVKFKNTEEREKPSSEHLDL
jgi:hypothetical protein